MLPGRAGLGQVEVDQLERGTVELDTGRITAAVADALLRVGALPPDSALLSGAAVAGGGAAVGGGGGWEVRMPRWRWQARGGEPARAGLAVRLPLRQATAVLERITAHGDLVTIQRYGHPWVTGEYWPMITPCFAVRAVDDAGGIPGR